MLSGQRNFAEQQVLSGEAQETTGNPPGFPAPSKQSSEQPPLADMSELDKFGLAGLLRMIHSDSPDVAGLAVGQDLMTLGLDLNQLEYGPSNIQSMIYADFVIIDRYIRPSLPRLWPPWQGSLWSKTSPFPRATTLPTSSLSSLVFRASAMRRYFTYSIACLATRCRKLRQKN